MRLEAALLEYSYSQDYSPTTRAWYRSRLGAFAAWLRSAGIADLDDITPSTIRQYQDYVRTRPSGRRGRGEAKPLDSFTVHGHTRAIKSFLNFLKKRDFTFFGWYRIALAIVYFFFFIK